jgi:bacterioferritin-associated ferredoxin
MYICLCKGITDKQIKRSVAQGAQSFQDVRKDLGVATQCCKCLPEARAIVNKTLQSQETSKPIIQTPIFFPAQIQT